MNELIEDKSCCFYLIYPLKQTCLSCRINIFTVLFSSLSVGLEHCMRRRPPSLLVPGRIRFFRVPVISRNFARTQKRYQVLCLLPSSVLYLGILRPYKNKCLVMPIAEFYGQDKFCGFMLIAEHEWKKITVNKKNKKIRLITKICTALTNIYILPYTMVGPQDQDVMKCFKT